MVTTVALLDFGAPELLIIFAIVLLLFGSKKLPELSRSLGESVRELKRGASDADKLRKQAKSEVQKTKDALLGTDSSNNPTA